MSNAKNLDKILTRLMHHTKLSFAYDKLIVALTIIAAALTLSNLHFATSYGFLVLTIFYGALLTVALRSRNFSRRHKDDIEVILKSSNLATLGILLKLRFIQKHDTDVVSAIVSLLNRIEIYDAGVLDDRQQRELWSSVFSYWHNDSFNERLAVSTIVALSKIGNAQMLARIEDISRRPCMSYKHRRVIATAQSQLSFMRQRLNTPIPLYLLRPSSKTHTSDTLLRPAVDTAQITDTPEQLLRAAPLQDTKPPESQFAHALPVADRQTPPMQQITTGQNSTPPV